MSYETADVKPAARRVPTKAACLRLLPVGMAKPLRAEAIRAVMTTYDSEGPFAARQHAKVIQDAFITYDGIERAIA